MIRNKELLTKIVLLAAGLLLAVLLLLLLGLNSLQLHYDKLRLQNELNNLRQDPLLKKSFTQNDSEISELEILRALAETQQLDFLSSKSGETTLEIVLQGSYKNFLEYLRLLETDGEIIQIDLSNGAEALEGRIIIKGAIK